MVLLDKLFDEITFDEMMRNAGTLREDCWWRLHLFSVQCVWYCRASLQFFHHFQRIYVHLISSTSSINIIKYENILHFPSELSSYHVQQKFFVSLYFLLQIYSCIVLYTNNSFSLSFSLSTLYFWFQFCIVLFLTVSRHISRYFAFSSLYLLIFTHFYLFLSTFAMVSVFSLLLTLILFIFHHFLACSLYFGFFSFYFSLFDDFDLFSLFLSIFSIVLYIYRVFSKSLPKENFEYLQYGSTKWAQFLIKDRGMFILAIHIDKVSVNLC